MDLTASIDFALRERLLLAHPFYRRWEAGELRDGELASYAAQYGYVERQLPDTLAALVAAASNADVRAALEANLNDERTNPEPHVELFARFARAVGAGPDPASDATAALVALYEGAPSEGVDFAVGVLAAYEVQAAAIARSKAEGLRDHYGLDATATEFWDVHAELEDDHADWSLVAAAALDERDVLRGVAASRDAWWAFLDERELAGTRA